MRIHEIFASVQGETVRAGLPTVFVRTSTCNLDCPWCDTLESRLRWEDLEIPAVIERVRGFGIPRVCVTGGEPLLEAEVPELVRQLLDGGCEVSVETNGTLPIRTIDPRAARVVDVKTPSAYGGVAAELPFLLENLHELTPLDALKFVIASEEDLDASVGFVEAHGLAAGQVELLFSPLHGRFPGTRLVAEILRRRWLNARLNLQIHKVIFGADARGV